MWIGNSPPLGVIVEHFKFALSLLILECSLIHLEEGFYGFPATGVKAGFGTQQDPPVLPVSVAAH